MLAELVVCLLITQILMKTVSTQYYGNPYGNQYYANMPQQYYEEQQEHEDIDYEDPIELEHTRRSNRHKTYRNSGGNLPNEYDDGSDECKCSCNRCKDTYRPPKPCCKEVCNSCEEQNQQSQGGGGVVFVPYPYPLLLPNAISNQTTTAQTTTTTAKATTKEPELTTVDDNLSNPDLIPMKYRRNSAESIKEMMRSNNLKSDKKYILTTMRKTKPTWEPKYNIVPIPDHLAQKLMSQMREVRELQTRRF